MWALYDTQPPAYEVTFRLPDGDEFSLVLNEDELAEPVPVTGIASQKKRAKSAV